MKAIGIVLLLLGLPFRGGHQGASPLHQIGWLAGCWQLRSGERVMLEMWMPPAGGSMLGASRTTVAGAVRETEWLRLEERGDTLLYIAFPSGQEKATFRSVEVTAEGFTVEDPTHDFPRTIVYRRLGPDSLLARIEGPGSDGPRMVGFPMARVSCRMPEGSGRLENPE
jgi:Domain of unknown function (DUF6265)